jgi:hypothetical protein
MATATADLDTFAKQALRRLADRLRERRGVASG